MSKEPKIAKQICKILSKHHLLNVKEINQYLEANGEMVNKTSIYRAIDRLIDSGLIRREIIGKDTKFELQTDHHDHVVCNKCYKIESVECSTFKKDVPGFLIDHHHTVLYGVCSDCSIE